MAATKLKCRVCGKEYEGCRTMKRPAGVFRWQDVACSPECGEEYLRQVLTARGQLPAETVNAVGAEEKLDPEFSAGDEYDPDDPEDEDEDL